MKNYAVCFSILKSHICIYLFLLLEGAVRRVFSVHRTLLHTIIFSVSLHLCSLSICSLTLRCINILYPPSRAVNVSSYFLHSHLYRPCFVKKRPTPYLIYSRPSSLFRIGAMCRFVSKNIYASTYPLTSSEIIR